MKYNLIPLSEELPPLTESEAGQLNLEIRALENNVLPARQLAYERYVASCQETSKNFAHSVPGLAKALEYGQKLAQKALESWSGHVFDSAWEEYDEF